MNSPVLHGAEGLLVGDVVHEDKAHGAAVVGCGDGPVALLPRRVLHTQHTGHHFQHGLLYVTKMLLQVSVELCKDHYFFFFFLEFTTLFSTVDWTLHI